MGKRLFIYFLIAMVIFVISFGCNYYVLKDQGLVPQFSLLSVYLFHALSSIVIYGIIELSASKLPDQAGYAYLVGVFVKMGFFILIFNDAIFGDQNLQKYERISLVVPLFLYLTLEAVASSRLLNKA